MLIGGNVTIYVSDMDRAVRFYTEDRGLRLRERYGDHWAAVDAGNGLVIGLHPATPEAAAGKAGSISIGFEATEPIERVVETLRARGVRVDGVRSDKGGTFASFTDPDGTPCYAYQIRAEYAR